ncbi:hypothetical protein JFT85_00865 [Pseudomonas sp. TH04]|uniref:hypothetical protein n=1 Tax=Pseudomonas sp. TH04 TaxID=2796370 RepID=UPI0019142549|nr:hypothetical protein [Pseudomonas sp. TH04]MBK5543317.1 hypothetical protein [Pseudomonas sp. TH04]
MDATPNNPIQNNLPQGIKEADLLEAIKKSGYPLQTRVAKKLSDRFNLHEEWSFKDRDSGTLRALDIFANMPLVDYSAPQPRTSPHLSILLECKQSELPFIFFETEHPARLTGFPPIAGLKSHSIEIATNEDRSVYIFSILTALGLSNHDFITRPPFSNTFSKCGRRGSSLELSGEDAYNSVVMPLIKAATHYEISEYPKPTYRYFQAKLTLPVAVLSAPMVITRSDGETQFTPWVRVTRHEYDGDNYDRNKSRFWAIDVVHEDYLSTYLDEHALPFAREFAEKVLKHDEELASCEGFTEQLDGDVFRIGVSALKPRPISKKVFGAFRNFIEKLAHNSINIK